MIKLIDSQFWYVILGIMPFLVLTWVFVHILDLKDITNSKQIMITNFLYCKTTANSMVYQMQARCNWCCYRCVQSKYFWIALYRIVWYNRETKSCKQIHQKVWIILTCAIKRVRKGPDIRDCHAERLYRRYKNLGKPNPGSW